MGRFRMMTDPETARRSIALLQAISGYFLTNSCARLTYPIVVSLTMKPTVTSSFRPPLHWLLKVTMYCHLARFLVFYKFLPTWIFYRQMKNCYARRRPIKAPRHK